MKPMSVESWCRTDLLQELENATAYGKEKVALAKQERPFCIVICGVFSSGKTSLINALLGTELPTGIYPVTHVVTRIRYGDMPRIVLKNLRTHEEWEVSQEDAQAIIVNEERNPRYGDFQICIETPSAFLRDQIEIIDTPGLNDDKGKRLDEVTKREIRQADFCIINYVCNQFATQDERAFLEEMQELTNGNFVSVLNCLNYLKQGEQQLKDLEIRAKQVLGEFGNDRIGKGRYFRVDSEDRFHAFLDGLDNWLIEIVRKYGRILQADTPLTMAYTELRRVKKACDDYVVQLSVRIADLRERNEAGIKKQKRQAKLDQNMAHADRNAAVIRAKDGLTSALTDGIREKLNNVRTQYGTAKYCEAAKGCIRIAVMEYADKLQRGTTGEQGTYAGIDAGASLRSRFEKPLAQFSVPEPQYTVHERGLFDLDRYFEGRTYRVYNDYVSATIDEIRSDLLPRLKLRIGEYFDEIGRNLEARESKIFVGGAESDIEQMEDFANRLSERSLDALGVLHDVRSLRDKLISQLT